MQTFITYSTLEECAAVLDYRRLGKQRVEALQIEEAIVYGTGWCDHSASRMWEDWIPFLRQYRRFITLEWCWRGYRNAMPIPRLDRRAPVPDWWGHPRLMRSHRAALLHKDYDFYSHYWRLTPELNYYWPEA